MGVYKYEKETINGKEYILMSSDLFYDFFCELMSYKKNADMSLVEHVKMEYEKAKRIKKKRNRLKREKIALLAMHDILLSSIKKVK